MSDIKQKAREMFDELIPDTAQTFVRINDREHETELARSLRFENNKTVRDRIKSFLDQIIDLAIAEEHKKFLSTLDDDSCECDNCNRTRRYFQNPKKELLRYKNKCEAEVKKAIAEERERVVEMIEEYEESYEDKALDVVEKTVLGQVCYDIKDKLTNTKK